MKDALEHVAGSLDRVSGSLDHVHARLASLEEAENERQRRLRFQRFVAVFLTVLSLIDLVALGWVVSVSRSQSAQAAANHDILTSVKGTASQLNDILSPTGCIGQFSAYKSKLDTWERQSTNAALHPDQALRVYPPDGMPPRPQAPPTLTTGRCKPLFDSFAPSLPK